MFIMIFCTVNDINLRKVFNSFDAVSSSNLYIFSKIVVGVNMVKKVALSEKTKPKTKPKANKQTNKKDP